ncbi:ABC transporter substrate-binding protein [Marinimicrococcus flavescens]|uniref:ABC transporter substrate-binding protein n=1 Tax=Marinimicrococcus flavescens TaxID=3031815 RepID=A0AAP3XPP7_9PROT|nr:ABC transporter substrate-binding protein [Marinimicrococcus flavescens]
MRNAFTALRAVLCASAAAAVIAMAPAPAAAEKVLRATMHADLRVIDPIWTTQTIAGIHGMLVYDTLFGVDDNLEPQPQMVGDYSVSDDGMTYSFTLRDGLKFHDGSPVTTEDVIASLERWGAKDQPGKALFAQVEKLEKVDDKTFKMILKAPYGLVLDTLGKTGTNVPIIMRAEDAATNPNEQITSAIGSGPFKMLKDEWVPGSKAVYVKNEDYVPRDEPPSGFAGRKEVKIDRLELVWIPDPQTAMQALIAGEIDILEQPPIDFLPILEGTPEIKVMKTGAVDSHWGTLRLNHMHPPFDKPEMRQAMYHLINQEDFMRSTVGDPAYYRDCHSYITCGTPYSNDAKSDLIGDYDPKKALEKMKAAGYNGEPITVLAATDHHTITPATQVLLNAMREAGLNVDAQSLDWGSVVARRAKKEKPSEGGWNIFVTTSSGTSAANPVINTWLGASCESANVGWPCDEELDALRTEFAFARSNDERKDIARKVQERAAHVVPYISWGQWTQPMAYRADKVSGIVPVTGLTVFWNIDKKE